MPEKELKNLRKAFGCYNTDKRCEKCPILNVLTNPRYKDPVMPNHDANEALRRCDFSSPKYPVLALDKVREYAGVA